MLLSKYNGKNVEDEDEEEVVEAVPKFGLSFTDDRLTTQILHSLNMMRKNRTFCDVVLHVGNSELFAHRAVLASASPHLLELFTTDSERNNRESLVTYKLNGPFEKEALEKLIDYAYTAKLDLASTEVRSVFVAASHLKMERVANEAAACLIDALSSETAIEIRNLLGLSRDKQLTARVDQFVASKFEEVQHSSSLLSLPNLKIELLSSSIQGMSLIGCESLCRLALDWTRRAGQVQGIPMEALLEKTHLLYLANDNSLQDCSDLPPGDASDTEIVQDYKRQSKTTGQATKKGKKSHPAAQKPRVILYSRDVPDDTEIERESDWKLIASTRVGEHGYLGLATMEGKLKTLSVLLRLNTTSGSGSGPGGQTTPTLVGVLPGQVLTASLTGKFGKPRKKNQRLPIIKNSVAPDDKPISEDQPPSGKDEEEDVLPIVGGGNEDEDEEDSILYCGLASMAAFKCGAGCGNLGGKLLVCGGYDRGECLRSVELYDPEKNAWESLSPMLEARGRFNIAVVEGVVYAVGGCNGTTELATVEKLDGGRWKGISSLPMARSNTGVCSLGGKIYCIGGWDGQVGIKQCDVFDPSTGKWSSISPLLSGRNQAGVCSSWDRVWVVGGFDGWNCLSTVEVYDTSNDTWSHGQNMNTPRRGSGLAFFNGKLYCVGGYDGSQFLCSTEVYDPKEKSWSTGPSMSTPRSNVGVAVIGKRLYAVGGFSGKCFLNTIEYLDEFTEEWTTFSPRVLDPSLLLSDHQGGISLLMSPDGVVGVVGEGNGSEWGKGRGGVGEVATSEASEEGKGSKGVGEVVTSEASEEGKGGGGVGEVATSEASEWGKRSEGVGEVATSEASEWGKGSEGVGEGDRS